jgi:hypothetical protein
MKNWFETLNAALESEGLTQHWDCFRPGISYGENVRFTVEVEVNGKIKFLHISIYRESDGRYERPIHYFR